MGANTGQTVLTVVGTAVGFYVGGPTGAQIGMTLGSLAGQALFPTQIRAPALGDLNVSTSQVGSPIPILFGVPKPIAGNIIFFAKPRIAEVVTEAKGGPEITSETRFFDIAVLLCEGPIFAVPRIWANGSIVYDVSAGASEETLAASEKFAEYFTFYPGNDTQLPDPTMEGYKGVGNVPAHRGTCYIMFHDLPGAMFNEQPPNFTFELIESGANVDADHIERATSVLYPWDDTQNPPLNCANDHEYMYPSVAIWRSTAAEALQDLITDTGIDPAKVEQYVGWSIAALSGTDAYEVELDPRYAVSPYSLDPGEYEQLDLHYNLANPTRIPLGDLLGLTRDEVTAELGLTTACSAIPDPVWWSGIWDTPFTGAQSRPGLYFGSCSTYPGDAAQFSNVGGSIAYYYLDRTIRVRRKVRAPPNPCEPYCEDAYPLLPESSNYCVIDDALTRSMDYTSTPLANGYKQLQEYTVAGVVPIVTKYPIGPIVLSGGADDTQAFWEAAYAADQALDEPYMAAGLTYPADYPVTTSLAYVREYTTGTVAATPITLAYPVERINNRCGLIDSEFDVSQLTESITGYIVTQTMSGREAINPLATFGFFEGADINGQIVYALKAREPDLTLTVDDLGAFEGGGGQAPSIFKVNRKLDEELPSKVRVNYNQTGLNTPGHAESPPWQLSTADNPADVSLAITMGPNKGAQIAESLWNEARTARQTGVLSTGNRKDLYPTRVISVDLGDVTHVIRLGGRLYSPPGKMEFEAVFHNVDDYTGDAVGASQPIYNDDLGLVGPTDLVLIDGPALTEASNDPGLFAAVRGIFSDWNGCTIYESADEGTTYVTTNVSATRASTMGFVSAAIPSGPTGIWDYGTTFTVTLQGDKTLESRTEEAVLNGANAAFVGAAGRWEVIQFVNAVLTSDGTYECSTLLRGRRGTEWAVGLGQAGDRFVLIDQNLLRIPLPEGAIGVPRLYKAVSNLRTVQTATAKEITPAGVALETYSPSHITGSRNSSGGFVIDAIRRTRISGEWLDNADVPLNEEIESYEVDILNGTNVARTLYADTPRVVYTLEHQHADFGAIQGSLSVRFYQMSAITGRGYPAEATVTAPTVYEDDDGTPIDPDNPYVAVTITFDGAFSSSDTFTIDLAQRSSNEHYVATGNLYYRQSFTLSGTGKASLADFADDLAAQVAADFAGPVTVTQPTATSVTITVSGGYITAYVEGVITSGLSFAGTLRDPLPITAGAAGSVRFSLFTPSGATWEEAPDFNGSYQNAGVGVDTRMYLGANTYDAVKARNGGNYFIESGDETFRLTWPTPYGTTNSTPRAALNGMIAAIYASAYLEPFGPIVEYDYAENGVVVYFSDPAYMLTDSNFISNGVFVPGATDDTQPCGYRLGCTIIQQPVVEYLSGAKQLDVVRWKSFDELSDQNPVVAGQKFTAILDGISYTHTATVPDESELYFDGIYDALKILIEASGDFTVTLVAGTNLATTPTTFTDYMEIERNVVNTPFTSAYFATYGGQVTITGS